MLATSNSSKLGLGGADWANTPLAITTKTATLDFNASDIVRPSRLTVDQESPTPTLGFHHQTAHFDQGRFARVNT